VRAAYRTAANAYEEVQEMASAPAPQIELIVRNCQGKIQPAVVQVDAGELIVVNNSDADATVVLPSGLGRDQCLWHCPPGKSTRVAIVHKNDLPPALLGAQIPYWVFFYDRSGNGIRDWGVAASPPAMQVGP
jgi:hypothetical protein